MRTWVLCLGFMGLNLSNRQIASALGLNNDTMQRMTSPLRQGIACAQPDPLLSGEVEADEVYVNAGHKGHPDAVKKGAKAGVDASKGARGRGTLAKDKPPILGLIQRSGDLVLRMLENVQQQTIEPIIRSCVSEGTRFYTDEYDIDSRLTDWGYDHHSVCHSRGEYARDDDGDGSMRSTSTRWRVSGRCCAPGCARTGASRRSTCRCA